MNLIFRPIGIITGLIAGLLGRRVFKALWAKVDDQEAPNPKQRQTPIKKLAAALVVQGAVFSLVKGLTDRGVREAFYRSTGTWPGKHRAKAK